MFFVLSFMYILYLDHKFFYCYNIAVVLLWRGFYCCIYRIAGKFGEFVGNRQIKNLANIKRRIIAQCAYVHLAKFKNHQNVLMSDSPKINARQIFPHYGKTNRCQY